MRVYLDSLQKVLDHGVAKNDRTGVGTISHFGLETLKFDLQDGFPLLTTKKVYWKAIVHELLWFLRGETNIQYLKDNGITIWDEWASCDGSVGPMYGHQLRSFGGEVDQIQQIITNIKDDHDSRRHVATTWNPIDLPEMALAPCHGTVIQFWVNGKELSCRMYQRSADMFLGLPFNIASYALLLSMIAQVTNKKPRHLLITLGDAHIYKNHIEQVNKQLSREPFEPPRLSLKKSVKDIDDFKFEDIKLINYQHHGILKGEVAI